MLCGFEIRSKGVCLSFYWGDYKSPGFNRSNLFLRRIENPPGRLAGSIIIITIMKIYPQNYGKVDIDS